MKGFRYFVVASLFLSCGFLGDKPFVKPKLPDKDLKEIIIHGIYAPEDEEITKKIKRELREGNLTEIDRRAKERLLSDKVGDEGFGYSSLMYCYNKTREEDKETILNKNIRVRLYDEEDNLLSSAYLRSESEFIHNSQSVIIYLPYHKKGSKYKVIRFEGRKEVFIGESKVFSQAYLAEKSLYYFDSPHPDANVGWSFDRKSECHVWYAH